MENSEKQIQDNKDSKDKKPLGAEFFIGTLVTIGLAILGSQYLYDYITEPKIIVEQPILSGGRFSTEDFPGLQEFPYFFTVYNIGKTTGKDITIEVEFYDLTEKGNKLNIPIVSHKIKSTTEDSCKIIQNIYDTTKIRIVIPKLRKNGSLDAKISTLKPATNANIEAHIDNGNIRVVSGPLNQQELSWLFILIASVVSFLIGMVLTKALSKLFGKFLRRNPSKPINAD